MIEYKVGDKFANITMGGSAVFYEILYIAPPLEARIPVVFVKETIVMLDAEGNEAKEEPRDVKYSSYYDFVVVYGDKVDNNARYGGINL